jgi:NAD(P)-dependent dehydrogenase (short-subunit alcohol dehydrogenase family)
MDAPAFDLSGASVLVVGASGGLGAPLTHRLAARGARLTLAARDEVRLRELAPPGTSVVGTDLRDAASAEAAVDAAIAAHGRLDGLVCIAGVVAFGPLVELTDETLVELVETNLLGPVRLMRAAVPRLREAVAAGRGGGGAPGGAFVLNVSAVIAESPVAGMAAYGASKAGLWAFDAAMARELRSARIRVVDARPPHTESGLADHPIAGTAPQLPRGLRPDDVARRLVEAIVSGERDMPSAAFTA